MQSLWIRYDAPTILFDLQLYERLLVQTVTIGTLIVHFICNESRMILHDVVGIDWSWRVQRSKLTQLVSEP